MKTSILKRNMRKKDTFSLLSIYDKTDSDKKNPDIVDL